MTDQPNPQPGPNATRLDCPNCDYNVGPTSDWTPGRVSRCPECGEQFVADYQARKSVPKPIASGDVIWHIFWPALVIFLCSIIPMVSLITMPLAVLILLPMTIVKAAGISERLSYHCPRPGGSGKRSTYAVEGILLWLAQVALMAFAAFGGCTIALNGVDSMLGY